jgi:regulatory protein YycH of two-component signal transduction system YycFG
MKFTAETLDMSGFEEADSNGVEFIASDDDDQKRAVKRAPNSTARAEVANKQSKQSTSTQPRQIVISDDEADEQPSTSKERVTIAKKVPRASLKATVDKAKKDFTPI